ncbi:MAG TPA: FISUMP domain-containing protein [Bacteroidota bacterium]|nr:FISUMP domain-containing protein [Bacteroidota bacterium]
MRVIMFLLLLLSFSTASAQWSPGQPIVDPRDGQSYATVKIGTQAWMAENLNIGVMIPSSAPGALMHNDGNIEKYCWDNAQANCDGTGGVMRKGGMYEWQEAVQYWDGQPTLPVRGICPEGWHIPSNAEWNSLLSYLGGAAAYTALLAGGASGFEALLTGYRCTMNGTFRASAMNADTRTYFWMAEQTDAQNAPFIEIGQQSLQAFAFQKSIGLCVRCIKDATATSLDQQGLPRRFELFEALPQAGRAALLHFAAQAGAVDVLVCDALGRTVLHRTLDVPLGERYEYLDLSACSAGVYVVHLRQERHSASRTLRLF